jgi:DNA-binding transcriptional regulator PaaX
MTIRELLDGLLAISVKKRTEDAINAKIKRLKAEGKLDGYKDGDTVFRSLTQRRR